MDEGDDTDLIGRVIEGDRRAFDLLMRRHEERIFAVCLGMMRDREAALDATQDTFLTVFRKAQQFRGDAKLTTWMHRIAVNTCLDRLRSRQRRATSPLESVAEPEDATATDPFTGVDLRPAIEDALSRIPDEYRAAIVLCDLQGASVAEAADVLEIAVGTVKSRLHRGRRLLARDLGNLRHPSDRPKGT
ncbi:MAG: RNA polymerase sigma factor SigM [Acidimicrobiia bacterium]|nr:RNA polymerase sigma factor SigM [Acidimicrobiia bacterium]